MNFGEHLVQRLIRWLQLEQALLEPYPERGKEGLDLVLGHLIGANPGCRG